MGISREKKLDEYLSDWRKEQVMKIQREYLHNDEAYLQKRMQTLNYGMDYWDLVEYYIEKRDRVKALETAEMGILKGEGWVTKLFEFLWEYYSKKKEIQLTLSGLCRQHYLAILSRRTCWTGYLNITG